MSTCEQSLLASCSYLTASCQVWIHVTLADYILPELAHPVMSDCTLPPVLITCRHSSWLSSMLHLAEQTSVIVLSLQVQQRDNEINILVSMLKKREAAMGLNPAPALHTSPAMAFPPAAQTSPSSSHSPPTLTSTLSHLTPALTSGSAEPHYGSSTSSAAPLHHQVPSLSSGQQQGQLPHDPHGQSHEQNDSAGIKHQQSVGPGDLLDTSVLADRGKAFDLFRWDHSSTIHAEWGQKVFARLVLCLFAGSLLACQCLVESQLVY